MEKTRVLLWILVGVMTMGGFAGMYYRAGGDPAAAGNYASDNDAFPIYPANYAFDNIISVAALAQDGSLASFSNYGKTSVDIAAPGVSILSTLPGNAYGKVSGTSFAAPMVASMLSRYVRSPMAQTSPTVPPAI